MSYRFMRIIVFFDLPMLTSEEKREYRRFKRFLEISGYQMMQESVYIKLALNTTAANALKSRLIQNKPKKGLVQMIQITEKQFQDMDIIVGELKKTVIDSDEVVVML